MMDDFERDLLSTLARRDAPAGFTEKVLARLEPPAAPARPRRRWQPALAGAIAAGLAAATFGLYQYQEYQRGVEAKRQLMFALEVTAQKLHVAQDKLNQRNQRP